MIFVSVGTQFPFDRLIMAVDAWAARNRAEDVVAQIGDGQYKPLFMTAYFSIPPDSFRQYQSEAKLLISHAGMGGILGALEIGKPLIIMPRQASLGEHRNDHQYATAKRFHGKQGIYVADDVEELTRLLEKRKDLRAGTQISSNASPELVNSLAQYLLRERTAQTPIKKDKTDKQLPVLVSKGDTNAAPRISAGRGMQSSSYVLSGTNAQKG